MLINPSLQAAALSLSAYLTEQNMKLTVAESCTGGALGAAITSIPGSSSWFESGFITYSNAAKMRLLGVQEPILAEYGAVSETVVAAMAQGALHKACADVAIAISGIAGPGGGTAEKPVGTVCFGFCLRQPEGGIKNYSSTQRLKGSRDQIREAAVQVALDETLTHLKKACIDIQ